MKKIIAVIGVICGVVTMISAMLYKIYLYTDAVKFPARNLEKLRSWFRGVKREECHITSRDGLYLHASAVKNNSDRWVILVHGYDSEGPDLSEYAEHFYDLGYSVLLPDLRGFGCSGGKQTTMGEKEQFDILDWIAFLDRREAPKKIVLFGVSLGASTVMLSSGRKLPENVAAAIEDCGYSSVYSQFCHNLRTLFHLPPRPFLFVTDVITRFKDGWSIRTGADCLKAISRSSLPTLFIHGSTDDFVPFYMQDELYSAASCPKEKLVIYGAGHAECMETDPKLYWSTVEGFLNKYV